jgi:hypothetical protein
LETGLKVSFRLAPAIHQENREMPVLRLSGWNGKRRARAKWWQLGRFHVKNCQLLSWFPRAGGGGDFTEKS